VEARRAGWRAEGSEDARLEMVGSWDIWITCPGARPDGPVRAGMWPRCTATVLGCHTGVEDNHLAYRGACLGCGWVAEGVHLLREGGENAGAEDANDHAWPGWRDLPVVPRPPANDGGADLRQGSQRLAGPLGAVPTCRVDRGRRADPNPAPGPRDASCAWRLPRGRL
jgi:hypothetical protein